MARDQRRTAAEVQAERALAAQAPSVDEQRPKDVGAFDNPAVESAMAGLEARKLARRHTSPELEALARRTLEANPCSKSAGQEEEAQRRELAHASRQMRPLLEAIEKASAGRPFGYERYKDGFDYRLKEAMTTVAVLCSYERLQPITSRKDGSKAGRPPRKTADALDELVLVCDAELRDRLRRKPTWRDVWNEMIPRVGADHVDANLTVNGKKIYLSRGEGRRPREVRKTSFATFHSTLLKRNRVSV